MLNVAVMNHFVTNLSKFHNLYNHNVFWHKCWRCSRLPFRQFTGNDVGGPLFSPFFFSLTSTFLIEGMLLDFVFGSALQVVSKYHLLC